MKTTLKKTMAALSAAAVVAASAAVMAVPTSAAGVSLTMGSKTLTLAELKAANYQEQSHYHTKKCFPSPTHCSVQKFRHFSKHFLF